jgi:hypothetical protein
MMTDLKLVLCLTALLENHVIPHAICLPAIIGEHKVRTRGSEKLTFDCDKKGITVEEKRLRSDFVMGQNGILYMLDDLLLPDRGNSEKYYKTETKTMSRCHPSCIANTVSFELRPRHSSGGYSPASHRGGPGSNPGLVMWDFVMDKSGAGAGFLRELRFPL